jgi:flagellar hook protein FlgE
MTQTNITNLGINGVSLGNITLVHGTNGVTQFSDANGTATVTALTQNGYAVGQYSSVAVNDSARIVASYGNGQ